MSASPPTDVELVRGLHARERTALVRVYGDHHVAIYNLCARILGDREEAKDVTQDVLLKAFASPPAATDDVRLRPWLFRVATNTCLNLIRSRRCDGLADPDLVAAKSDPFGQARSAALIEGALGAVNERYRAALVLKDIHGVGGAELAEVLEISRPAADVLVHRARAAFRRAFTGLAGDDAVAPANLAVALPMLAAPAALQALPLSIGHALGAPGVLPPAVPGAGAASGAGPAVGVLGKITAALGTKAAVIAAGAAIVAGGSVAVVGLAGQTTTPAPASGPASTALTAAGSPGGQLTEDGSPHDLPTHHAHGDGQTGSHHGEGDGHHIGGHAAVHDATTADHAGDGSHTTSGSHDSTGSHSGSSESSTTETHTSTTSGTHDGGESGHDGGD
jgi:RNA polymerase sigma-70 factor, ECF subfamily